MEPSACSTDSCLTCGDVAVEVVIARLLPDEMAVVRASAPAGATGSGEREEEVSVALVRVAEGDTVLVHAGEAIAVVGGRA